MLTPSVLASDQKQYSIYAGIYPPYLQEDNKGSTDIIIQKIFEASDIQVDIIHVPLKRLGKHYIGNNQVAGIYGVESLALAYAKKEKLLIGKPFQIGRFQFWYFKPNMKKKIKWNQFSDLKGYKISVPLGSLLTQKLVDAGLDIDFASNADAHIRKLVLKRASLAPLFYFSATNVILEYYPEKLHEFSYLEKPISITKFSLILNKGFHQADEIMKHYHTGLDQIVKNGSYLKLLEELYGKGNIPKEYQELVFNNLNYTPDIAYK